MTELSSEKRSPDDDGTVSSSAKRQKLAGTKSHLEIINRLINARRNVRAWRVSVTLSTCVEIVVSAIVNKRKKNVNWVQKLELRAATLVASYAGIRDRQVRVWVQDRVWVRFSNFNPVTFPEPLSSPPLSLLFNWLVSLTNQLKRRLFGTGLVWNVIIEQH